VGLGAIALPDPDRRWRNEARLRGRALQDQSLHRLHAKG